MTINEFLVKCLVVSYEEALMLIRTNQVFVNGIRAKQKQIILDSDQIQVGENELQSPRSYQYILYYKPRGVECTLNPEIKNNLLQAFPLAAGLFPVGRLDKDSEGLLLLTDDGKLYKRIAGSEVHQEKEYDVEVDKSLPDEDIESLRIGIEIMGKKTRLAEVTRLDKNSFRIILTQGLNRQIRRMCYKLGYQVTSLKRIRIASLSLDNLKPGEYRLLSKEEIP